MTKDIRTQLDETSEKNYQRVRQEMATMLMIEERPVEPYCFETAREEQWYKVGKWDGVTEQKAIDHSEEHLNWIIKQHHLWAYEMCHCDNNDTCTFKEWIDKAMEG